MKKQLLKITYLTAMLIGFAVSMNAQTDVMLPAATEWRAPVNAPAAPGDGFALNFPLPNVTVDANAPVVGEWNRTAKPNESITLTGIRFTLRTGVATGSDTRVLIYAKTLSGGMLAEGKVFYITNKMMIVTMPDNIPFGMYLLWVENEKGFSAPIVINQPMAMWIGPLGPTAAAGSSKRVFGKNLSTNHGELTSYVYLQPAAGGTFISCTVTKVEPYAVNFTIPSGTANGNYKVYVHNGHGGDYGWSSPLDLTIATPWQRGSTLVSVPLGGNIQTAIDNVAAQTNGGTVQLASGTYNISALLNIKQNVKLQGAGISSTILEISNSEFHLAKGAGHITLQDFTIRPSGGSALDIHSESVHGGGPNTDLAFINVNFDVYPDQTSNNHLFILTDRFEVSGCKFNAVMGFDGRDVWHHNNELHGGRAAADGAIGMQQSTQAPHGRLIVENNTASTPNWPNQGGNRNYKEYLSTSDIGKLIWCSRLFFFQMGADSYEYSYISHNTTTDVAIDDNKGEIILFHAGDTEAFAQVASNTGRTLTIRSDGTINGSNAAFYADSWTNKKPMTTIPNTIMWGTGVIDNSAYVVIMNGTGMGQINKIASHTANTVTVQKDWRLAPDTSSVFMIQYCNTYGIQYKNNLSAFPVGFVNKNHCASYGVNYDGNALFQSAEGNTNTRTFYGDAIQAYMFSPGYFNEMRDEKCISPLASGPQITARAGNWGQGSVRVAGPVLMGCWIRGGTSDMDAGSGEVVEGWGNTASNIPLIQGSGIENVNVKTGLGVASLCKGLLYRNNMLNNSSISLGRFSDPLFVTNGAKSFTQPSANTLPEKPVPVYHTAHFNAANLSTQQNIPVADAGVISMTWSVSVDKPWIIAAVGTGTSSVAAEAVTGQLLVSIDKSKLPAGVQTGLITITSNNKTTSVGVFVDPNGVVVTGVSNNSKMDYVLLYPNPTSNNSVIRYSLIENSSVEISIYDVMGKEVLLLANEKQSAGEHLLNINTEKLQNGIYFVKMNVNGGEITQKLILNK